MKRIVSFLLAGILCLALIGCGGSAQPSASPAPTAEPTTEPAPAASWEILGSFAEIQPARIGTDSLRAWVLVENTGAVPLKLDSIAMDVETVDGKLLQTFSYVGPKPGVILPGERGVWEQKSSLKAEAPEGELQVHALPKLTECDPARRVATSDVELFTDNYGLIKARGRVVNDGEEPLKNVWVVVLCYDASGNFLGSLWCQACEELPAGERQGFETAMADGNFAKEGVAAFDVIAWPYFG